MIHVTLYSTLKPKIFKYLFELIEFVHNRITREEKDSDFG